MKVDLHKPFLNLDGKPIEENGTVQMMDRGICTGLFSGAHLKPSGNPEKDAEAKLRAYLLCQKLAAAQGPADFTVEELADIKLVASLFNPGAYGQIYEAIEGK